MNPASIIIGLVILTVFAAIVGRGIVNRRQGKSGCACGGDCSHCAGCNSGK